jgi:hypothetical protein
MNLIILLLTSVSSWAYIPDYSMIISRTADQHGKGTYWIEQDVTFKRETESYTVKESWLVVNENALKVTLEGKGNLRGLVQGTILFQGAQKYFLDGESSQIRTQKLGEDWMEPLFHFRSSKYLQSRMSAMGIRDPHQKVRLTRAGGGIAWAIGGDPAQAGQPMLWLEQDQFVIRKLRSADQTLLRANDYVKFDEGLWFPRQRIYSFGNYTIEIQTTRVKHLDKRRPDDKSMKTASLVPKKDGLKLPDVDGLKEFYSRFR